ncbi:unnamed protein product, partial [Effrenium voratum]
GFLHQDQAQPAAGTAPQLLRLFKLAAHCNGRVGGVGREGEPGRSRALKMLLRMINLEVKTRQAHRRENLLRAVLDAFQCQVQVARHVRGTFTEQEAEAVHEAFERCTGPRVELGSENSLFWCLADLGLTGSSVNEKRRVWEQIALAFGNPMEKEGVEGLGGQEMVPYVAPELMFYVEEEAASDKLQALMRNLADLILYVLPAVRRVLEEHCEEELSQKVQRLDSDIDVNRMPISLCARAARLLGALAACGGAFMAMLPKVTMAMKRRSILDYESPVEKMDACNALAGAVGSCNSLAGRALQRCRERVARRLRRKELQVKQESSPSLELEDRQIAEQIFADVDFCSKPTFLKWPKVVCETLGLDLHKLAEQKGTRVMPSELCRYLRFPWDTLTISERSRMKRDWIWAHFNESIEHIYSEMSHATSGGPCRKHGQVCKTPPGQEVLGIYDPFPAMVMKGKKKRANTEGTHGLYEAWSLCSRVSQIIVCGLPFAPKRF